MDTVTRTHLSIKARLLLKEWKPGERMPSLASLADSCKVSRTTMWRAMAILKHAGLVHTKRGGAIVAGPEGTPRTDLPVCELVWKGLKSRLGNDILAGVFSENGLPPVSKSAPRYGVAINTLKKALEALVDEGLLSVRGRRYLPAQPQAPRHRTTVLLFTHGNREVGVPLGDPRTHAVFESFERECLRSGYAGRAEGFDSHDPKCLVEATARVRALPRLDGCIINIWNPWHETRWRRWLDLLNFLAHRGVPVVIIDQSSNLIFPDSLLMRPNFRVLHIASIRAGEMVGAALLRRGYRRVAYIAQSLNPAWAKDRYTGLCRFYKQYGGSQSMVELFACESEGSRKVPMNFLLNRVLAESSATAWACSDEQTALAALSFLRKRHKRVPEDVALLGFDNWIGAYEQQITSYDFNMPAMVGRALLLITDPKALKDAAVIGEVEGQVVERWTTRR